jgi:hypothetical protein
LAAKPTCDKQTDSRDKRNDAKCNDNVRRNVVGIPITAAIREEGEATEPANLVITIHGTAHQGADDDEEQSERAGDDADLCEFGFHFFIPSEVVSLELPGEPGAEVRAASLVPWTQIRFAGFSPFRLLSLTEVFPESHTCRIAHFTGRQVSLTPRLG